MLQAPRIVRWTLPALLLTLVVGCLLIVAFNGRDSAPDQVSNGSSTADGKHAARRMTARHGDTATAIARRAKITLLELLELNPDLDPRALRPGQKLRIRR
jgi:LysM repeat protein